MDRGESFGRKGMAPAMNWYGLKDNGAVDKGSGPTVGAAASTDAMAAKGFAHVSPRGGRHLIFALIMPDCSRIGGQGRSGNRIATKRDETC